MSNTTTIKLSKIQKSMAYHTYRALETTMLSVINYRADADEQVKSIAVKLSELVKSIHGESIDGTAMFYNLLIRHASEKTTRADGVTRVKLNGIATFTKWIKDEGYVRNGEMDLVSNAGKNPDAPKAEKKSVPSTKEAAMNILKNLPKEELNALIEALIAA